MRLRVSTTHLEDGLCVMIVRHEATSTTRSHRL